jgi:hypothetical protein
MCVKSSHSHHFYRNHGRPSSAGCICLTSSWSFFFFTFSPPSTRDWTQVLTLARQVLSYWTTLSALLFVFSFWDRFSIILPKLVLNSWSSYLHLPSSWGHRKYATMPGLLFITLSCHGKWDNSSDPGLTQPCVGFMSIWFALLLLLVENIIWHSLCTYQGARNLASALHELSLPLWGESIFQLKIWGLEVSFSWALGVSFSCPRPHSLSS